MGCAAPEERWLLEAGTRRSSAGAALAPEDLLAALTFERGFWFVGQSGTTYESREPLGPFLRSSAPLEPLVRVTAAGRTVLGIPADRSLLRSVDGAASFGVRWVNPDTTA
jgi:hypothetical protein